MSKTQRSLPTALTIASSDSGCGAGIQADLLTFAALDVFGTTAIAALTAQNPQSVTACVPMEPEFLRSQIDQVLTFFPVQAIKTGMLYSQPLILEVARSLHHHPMPLVVDPVMVSSSGHSLLQPEAKLALINELLPRATLITPNLDEAEAIMGARPQSFDEMSNTASAIAARFNTAVLLKGGHLTGDALLDVLAHPNGDTYNFYSKRILNIDTHGSGCTLSAAITAQLAKGYDVYRAVEHGHNCVQQMMLKSLSFRGKKFINHRRHE